MKMRAVLLLLISFSLAPVAGAHPLGNFSINQYWLLDMRGDDFKIFYMLDIAEIPSFTEMDRLDTDMDEKMSAAEIDAYLDLVAPELMNTFEVSVDGKEVGLQLHRKSLEVYEGSGGMPVFNIFLDMAVTDWDWPQSDARDSVRFSSTIHENAQGYREAVVLVDDRYEIEWGPYKDHDLLRYMQLVMKDELGNPLLQSFYNVFQFELHSGDPEPLGQTFTRPDFDWTATARVDTEEKIILAQGEKVLEPVTGEPSQRESTEFAVAPDRATPSSERSEGMLKTITDTIRSEEPTTVMVIIAMAIALLLGMGHAFSPGHGKTVMAAYLIGERGTVWHAFVLGVIVTVVHVWSVFLLGIVILFAGEKVEEQTLVFWTSLASGVIIVGIGILLFVRRYRSYVLSKYGSATSKHEHSHDHDHDHSHDHHHDHNHTHNHTHDHDHSHDHPHDHSHDHSHHHDHGHHHGPGGHSHVIEGVDGKPPTYWNIFWLGVSGGIVPCPAALIVLLLAINLGKLGLGLLMITTFSIGLAAVLVAIGIAVVKASGSVRERIGDRSPILLLLPVISSILITGLGCMMVFMTLVQFNIIVLPG